ncbi:MAG TPA: sulfatase [Rubrobacter sp.]|nr:sulfatase [Rubrobacter sp.]
MATAGCSSLTGVVHTPDRPNVILVLTDDLDARLLEEHLANYPHIRKLTAEGTTFENAFVTDSLCCPSRATILRGQYPHNTGVLSNGPPNGGYEKFRDLGRENSTVATWLQDAGYRTVLIGKYMNGYHGTRVPPGWDKWYGISGGHLSSQLNENGHIVDYDPEKYHLDDVLAQKAIDYVHRAADNASPFFMWLGTTAPHAPATPTPRYKDAFPNAQLPRPPSFDEEDVSDKPDWIRDNPPLGQQEIAYAEDLYRKRLQSMLSVDDMIGRLVDALKESGELDNTYIFFTSDNGWHAGEHRLTTGKWTAYEEDIRVPLIVRGPGVPGGRKLKHLVLNNDFAPTFADLGGAKIPDFVDGRSLTSLLSDHPPSTHNWRQAFLVEEMAESAEAPSSITEEAGPRLLTGDVQPSEDVGRASPLQKSSVREAGRPGLKAIRTENSIYVEYDTGESELYDLRKDPYELNNVYEKTDLAHLWRLQGWLRALRDCAGEECRAAENGRF